MSGLNWLDILALGLLGASAVAGLFKGLVRELVSLLSVVAGIVLALLFYPMAAQLLTSLGVGQLIAAPLGFVGIFLVSITGGALLVRLIRTALKVLHLTWADRMLGGLFGLARGWLVNVVIFLSLATFPVSENILAGSRTAEFFLTSAKLLLSFSSSDLKQRFDAGFERVYQIWVKENLEDGRND